MLAKVLPICLVTEQIPIALMWNDMVKVSAGMVMPFPYTFSAQWMLDFEHINRLAIPWQEVPFTPRLIDLTRRFISLLSPALMLRTSPAICEGRTAGMGALLLGLEWHRLYLISL